MQPPHALENYWMDGGPDTSIDTRSTMNASPILITATATPFAQRASTAKSNFHGETYLVTTNRVLPLRPWV